MKSLQARLRKCDAENSDLHKVAQESNDQHGENLKLSSELELLRADHDSLQKENDYYKDDLLPTMREKNLELQRKFCEFEDERKALADENATMRQGNQSDNDQLLKLQNMYNQVFNANETAQTQISLLQSRFDDQQKQYCDAEASITRY